MLKTVRTKLKLSIIAAATLLTVGACDGETVMGVTVQPPVVTTQRAVVSPGESMPLTLENLSVKSWTYGQCSYAIDRLDAGTWTNVFDANHRLCAAVGYSLRGGQRVTYSVETPSAPGTYRVRFRFLHVPRDRAVAIYVASNTYQVQ